MLSFFWRFPDHARPSLRPAPENTADHLVSFRCSNLDLTASNRHIPRRMHGTPHPLLTVALAYSGACLELISNFQSSPATTILLSYTEYPCRDRSRCSLTPFADCANPPRCLKSSAPPIHPLTYQSNAGARLARGPNTTPATRCPRHASGRAAPTRPTTFSETDRRALII